MKRLLAFPALALLLAPAAASAHPGVYTVTQKVLESGDLCRLPDDSCIGNATRTQYAVGNDGWANSFTEGNNAPAGRGALNYKLMPGTWRGTDRAAILAYAPGHTELQAHAICTGAAWDTAANILAWQNDPFFNYIPWQKTSAGLGDEPEKWIPLVKSLTGVDLNTATDLPAACVAAGGAYYAADQAASITTAQMAAATAAATAPLQSQITTLQTGISSLQAQLAAIPKRPLALTLAAKRFAQGAAMVTGEANTSVLVRMRVTSATARKYKVSRTLVTKTVSLGNQGAALVSLQARSAAAKAITRRVNVTVEAVAGGVVQTVGGVYVG